MSVLQSVITCPHCARQEEETVPTNACQFFYPCKGCGVMLRPKPGDCCVFCSYGSVPCPSMQQEGQERFDPRVTRCYPEDKETVL